MATDFPMLGGITFDQFSTPEHMGFGGDQAMAIHRLPGDARVIDIPRAGRCEYISRCRG